MARTICPRCRAELRRRKFERRGVPFDVRSYEAFYRLSQRPQSRCIITGASLHQLQKLGLRLEIDRIVPELGYTDGNLRLLASSLNIAKGARATIPAVAVARLMRRLERLVHDRFSKVPALPQ